MILSRISRHYRAVVIQTLRFLALRRIALYLLKELYTRSVSHTQLGASSTGGRNVKADGPLCCNNHSSLRWQSVQCFRDSQEHNTDGGLPRRSRLACSRKVLHGNTISIFLLMPHVHLSCCTVLVHFCCVCLKTLDAFKLCYLSTARDFSNINSSLSFCASPHTTHLNSQRPLLVSEAIIVLRIPHKKQDHHALHQIHG